MKRFAPYLFFLFATLINQAAFAQVLINEFSAANENSLTDNYGEYEDWVELYNPTNAAVDLSGYFLSDKMSNPDKFEIPAGVTIPANGHLLVWCSSREEFDGTNLHTNFKITQTRNSEAILLADPSENILDFHEIDIPNQLGHSRGRVTDGSSDWGVFTNPSAGTTNNNSLQEYAATPGFDQSAGFYNVDVTVTISSPEPVAIYYTSDGSSPTAASTLYTAPLVVDKTTVLRAIAVSADPTVPNSFIKTKTFFIDENHTIPVVSIAGDELNTLLNGSQFEPEGHFELFDETGDRVSDASGLFNKHGNDSWFYDQRGIDYITKDEFGYDYAVKEEIFPNTDRDKFQRLILKAAANDNYPFEEGGAHIRDAYVQTLSQRANLELDERSNEPCALYLNGVYWGLYEMREKVDDSDFTDYHYNQDTPYLQYIKTWGMTWEEYGTPDALPEWNTLVDFIQNNDMAIPANYATVADELNVVSLVDYMILNTQVVCADWLNWNTAWWRGKDPDGDAKKWRYTLWDMDATFGHYINYTGIPDTTATADPCNIESPTIDDPQGHTDMLTALLENPDFFALYINRYADLNNTYFTCDSMIGILDEMVTRIEPEMAQQIARWGGTMAEWQDNVQTLRDFILARCTVIDSGIEDCYEVEGPYNLTIVVEPPGAGEVLVNTILPSGYPYVSDYFSGVPISLTAIPQGSNFFDYWEPLNSTLNPNITNLNVTFDLVAGDTIIAYFIDSFTCPGSLPITGEDLMCYQDNSGTASINIPNGFDILWSNGETTADVSNLAAGNYTVTATAGQAACTLTASITLTEPASFSTFLQETNNFCVENAGSVNSVGIGGVPPYTYLWNTGDTNPSIGGLATGTYTVTITDSEGCAQVGSVQVSSLANGPILSSIATNVSCSGSNDGAIDLTVMSGTPPFTFDWGNGINQEDVTGLPPGFYSVIVTDANGCIAVNSVEITQAAGLTLTPTSTSSSGNDGTATVVVTGGVSPFTYQWNNGQTTQIATDLSPGTYTVFVTDANGCVGQTTVTVDAFTGLATVKNLSTFSIFPNPNKGNFQVELLFTTSENIQLEVWNGLGQRIAQYEGQSDRFLVPFELGSLAAGVYAVRLVTEGGEAVRQVLVVE